jgi:hypothetical protein
MSKEKPKDSYQEVWLGVIKNWRQPMKAKGKKVGKVTEAGLKAVMEGLLDMADKERQADPKYQEMFKKGTSYGGLISEVEHQMQGPALDACDVLEKRFGIKCTNEVYTFVLAIPLLSHLLEKKITAEESSVCCVDKTHYIMSAILEKIIKLQELK